MTRGLVALLFLLTIPACAGDVDTSPETTAATVVPSTEPGSPTATSSTFPPVVECPGSGDFGEGGSIVEIDGAGSDSSHLGRITWDRSNQCESFRFEFETSEGAPATTVPDVSIAHLDSLQVIRITMDIDAAVITDQLVETDLVDRLYVVRSIDGTMFVDLHLREPAAARARVESSPAVLAVELRPGFLDFNGVSAVDDDIVVVSPTTESEVGAQTTFDGYARTFEANVVIIVTHLGEVVTETSTTAADYIETWGQFTVDMTLPEGEVSVFLGESSPEDGDLAGISLDLQVG